MQLLTKIPPLMGVKLCASNYLRAGWILERSGFAHPLWEGKNQICLQSHFCLDVDFVFSVLSSGCDSQLTQCPSPWEAQQNFHDCGGSLKVKKQDQNMKTIYQEWNRTNPSVFSGLHGPLGSGIGLFYLVKWDIEKEFFPVSVGKPWNRNAREDVAAPFLKVSKARLDGTWSNLG